MKKHLAGFSHFLPNALYLRPSFLLVPREERSAGQTLPLNSALEIPSVPRKVSLMHPLSLSLSLLTSLSTNGASISEGLRYALGHTFQMSSISIVPILAPCAGELTTLSSQISSRSLISAVYTKP